VEKGKPLHTASLILCVSAAAVLRISKKVVESISREEKRTGTAAEALGAGRQATAAAPPSCNQGVTRTGAQRAIKDYPVFHYYDLIFLQLLSLFLLCR
jgi:hypothetical protein